jgi:hypothetical protein
VRELGLTAEVAAARSWFSQLDVNKIASLYSGRGGVARIVVDFHPGDVQLHRVPCFLTKERYSFSAVVSASKVLM